MGDSGGGSGGEAMAHPGHGEQVEALVDILCAPKQAEEETKKKKKKKKTTKTRGGRTGMAALGCDEGDAQQPQQASGESAAGASGAAAPPQRSSSQDPLRQLKSLCKRSPAAIEAAHARLQLHMADTDVVARAKAMRIINTLFMRSAHFRRLVLPELRALLDQSVIPFNPKKASRPERELRETSLRIFKGWQQRFQEKFPQLRMASSYLERVAQVNLDLVPAEPFRQRGHDAQQPSQEQEVQAQRESAREEQQRKLLELQATLTDHLPAIEDNTTQLANSLDLLQQVHAKAAAPERQRGPAAAVDQGKTAWGAHGGHDDDNDDDDDDDDLHNVSLMDLIADEEREDESDGDGDDERTPATGAARQRGRPEHDATADQQGGISDGLSLARHRTQRKDGSTARGAESTILTSDPTSTLVGLARGDASAPLTFSADETVTVMRTRDNEAVVAAAEEQGKLLLVRHLPFVRELLAKALQLNAPDALRTQLVALRQRLEDLRVKFASFRFLDAGAGPQQRRPSNNTRHRGSQRSATAPPTRDRRTAQRLPASAPRTSSLRRALSHVVGSTVSSKQNVFLQPASSDAQAAPAMPATSASANAANNSGASAGDREGSAAAKAQQQRERERRRRERQQQRQQRAKEARAAAVRRRSETKAKKMKAEAKEEDEGDDAIFMLNMAAAQNLHRVWSSGSDVDEHVNVSRLICRDERDTLPIQQPTLHTCGAPLAGRTKDDGNPALCKIQGQVRCPIHGPLIARDPVTGQPLNEKKESAKRTRGRSSTQSKRARKGTRTKTSSSK